ncbi:MAG: ABC transporter ATP-binding protein [Elusimicrobia bacterium]|nr:ABC transporter ATP-binding protein [Elusimicrobiota bacterium]
MSKILEIEGLIKSYKYSHLGRKSVTLALKGLTLDVMENDIFALIGLNGSGKTTTIKILLGLIRPDTGIFRIFGSENVNNDIKRMIGYLPEIPYFNSEFTPGEILRFWGSITGMEKGYLKKRISEVLRYTSLEHVSSRKIKGFSRGMLQRLGIAQSILAEPGLLILDEPMGGLDPKGIIDIRNLMLKLKKDGHTIFFTSHLISEVEKVADKVGMLGDGKILKIVEPHPDLEQDFLDTINQIGIPDVQ